MKGTSPFTVEASHVEQVVVTCSKDRREALIAYLRGNGWYIARSGPPVIAGRLDEKLWRATCVRKDTMRDASELQGEIESDLGRL